MFPLERAMLPGEELPLRIFEPRYSALVSDCLAMDDPAFGVVLIAAGREVGGGDTRSDVGCAGPHRRGRRFRRRPLPAQLRDGRADPGASSGIRTTRTRRPRSSCGPTSPGESVGVDAIQRHRGPHDRRCSSGSPVPAARRQRAGHRCGRRCVGRCRNVVVRVGGPSSDGAGRPVCGAGRADGAARLAALSDAVETVSAMVEFQLSGD